jgi:hypothetical protein
MLYRLIHILVFLCMLLGLEMAPGQCGARGDMMLQREPASGQRRRQARRVGGRGGVGQLRGRAVDAALAASQAP